MQGTQNVGRGTRGLSRANLLGRGDSERERRRRRRRKVGGSNEREQKSTSATKQKGSHLVPSRLKLVSAFDLSGSAFPASCSRAMYFFLVKRSYALAAPTCGNNNEHDGGSSSSSSSSSTGRCISDRVTANDGHTVQYSYAKPQQQTRRAAQQHLCPCRTLQQQHPISLLSKRCFRCTNLCGVGAEVSLLLAVPSDGDGDPLGAPRLAEDPLVKADPPPDHLMNCAAKRTHNLRRAEESGRTRQTGQ